MQSWEWFGFGWSEEWAMLLIVFLGILGITMSTVFDDAVFAMVTSFCLFGVAQKNFREARSAGDIQEVHNLSDFSYGFMLFISSVTMGILVLVFSFKPIAKGYSELLYKTLFNSVIQETDAVMNMNKREHLLKRTTSR